MQLGRKYIPFVQIALMLVSASLTASEPTYQYDPHVTTLTGVLNTRTFPGAPNYESIKNGDRPNKIWLLKLRQPISMTPDPNPNSFNEKETGIREIHVILTDLKGEKALKEHEGETVALTGTIFHATTIHHPLTILMDVQSYKVPPKGRN